MQWKNETLKKRKFQSENYPPAWPLATASSRLSSTWINSLPTQMPAHPHSNYYGWVLPFHEVSILSPRYHHQCLSSRGKSPSYWLPPKMICFLPEPKYQSLSSVQTPLFSFHCTLLYYIYYSTQLYSTLFKQYHTKRECDWISSLVWHGHKHEVKTQCFLFIFKVSPCGPGNDVKLRPESASNCGCQSCLLAIGNRRKHSELQWVLLC